ncbi:hypothetical protein AB0C47_09845 [Micromonospora taraxaci]|uniref:hypothetical protein n=2 Tax=Micromonospora TaxID=1873 RepID=UPI0033C344E3
MAPSGGVVSIDAPDYDLGEPWLCGFRLRLDRPYVGTNPSLQERALQIARSGNCKGIIERVIKGRIVEEASGQGGRFLVARSDLTGSTIVVWQGRWHEVFDFIEDPEVTSLDALRRFDRLSFQDSPVGLRVRTSPVPAETMFAERVYKTVPGVGNLSILPAEQAVDLVPRHRGAQVASGEVWRKEVVSDQGTRTLLLHATTTTVTIVDPEANNPDETPRLQFLDRLSGVAWTRP